MKALTSSWIEERSDSPLASGYVDGMTRVAALMTISQNVFSELQFFTVSSHTCDGCRVVR